MRLVRNSIGNMRRRMTRIRLVSIALALTSPMTLLAQHIYWGDSVPKAWNGQWPAELRTVAEQTHFTRTMSTLQLHEYIETLKWKSDRMHVISMFISPMRKVAPAIVLSNPRVTSPQQAKA